MDTVMKIINEYKEIGSTEDLVLDEVEIEHITPEMRVEIEKIKDL